MGVLHDLKNSVEATAASQGRDVCLVRGEISRKAGFMLALIGPSSPDDPDKIDRLRSAAFEILNTRL